MLSVKDKTLLEAVKIAKDQNIDDLPDQMNLNSAIIPNEKLMQ